MKIINKYIFKSLVSPFILSTFAITIVLLTQLILKKINMFLGEGIPGEVIFKFFIYNTGAIISLAIPMAVLIATIMTFGKLASDNEITAFRANGISYTKLLIPALSFGFIIVSIMIPFNLWILPDMNKKSELLLEEINISNPTTNILDGYVKNDYDNLNKVVFVGKENESDNIYSDVIIHDKINTILTLANTGSITSLDNGLIFDLEEGTIHQKTQNANEYRIIYFDDYYVSVPFKENSSTKNYRIKEDDRKLNINELIGDSIPVVNLTIEEKSQEINVYDKKLNTKISELDAVSKTLSSEKLSYDEMIENNLKYNQIVGNINKIKDKISKLTTNLDERINRRDGFLVEIHKKFSLPFSCFIFILLGIPLGIISKNGGMAVSVSISLLFFILYWGFLTVGEFLAEDGTLNPALSMWLGNLIVGALSMLLFYLTSKENITLNLNFLSRLLIKKTS